MNRIWLSGWQCDQSVFEALLPKIQPANDIFINYHDTDLSLDDWIESFIQQLPNKCTLIGWSLGGMLACEAANRSTKIKRVFALNSNVQFSGGAGLEPQVAEAFQARYENNPQATRRKFSMLVDPLNMDAIQAKLLDGNRSNKLNWLYDLNISRLSKPTYILLSQADQLVPVESATQAWQALGANVTLTDGHHGLPITQPDRIAQWLAAHE